MTTPKRSCLRCGVRFEPRKAGHVFCRPECRHLGPRHPDETPPPPPFDAAAVERLTDGPGGEALLRRAVRLYGVGIPRERCTLVAAKLREVADLEVHELFEDALASFGKPGTSRLEHIAMEEGSNGFALLDLVPAYFAPGWRPFPATTTTPAQVAMDEAYARVKRERAA